MRKTWLALVTLGTTGLLACSGGNQGDTVALNGGDDASGTGGSSDAGGAGGASAGGNSGSTGGSSSGSNAPNTVAPGTTATQDINFIPTFPGAGSSPEASQPLASGMVCDLIAGETVRATRETTRCFFGPESKTEPAATVEQVLECVDGTDSVHLRLTLDPHFVDNTYGAGSIGWPVKRGHRFSDLVKSDHAELVLMDGAGDVAMQFKMDYITEDADSPSGYGTLGVLGGDGSVAKGSADHILAVKTSLSENLNTRGYGSYLVDSPLTDEAFTANPDAPEWDYRLVYDVWVDLAAFGDAGFSGAFIEYVHASPSKKPSDTIEVIPGECPPCQDTPDTTCGEQPPLTPPDGVCGDMLDEDCPGDFDYTGGSMGSTGGSMGGTGGSVGGTGGSMGGTGGSACGDLPDDQCPGNVGTGGTTAGTGGCGLDGCGEGNVTPPPSGPPAYCDRYPSDPACTLG